MKRQLLILLALFTACLMSCQDEQEYVESQTLCFATAYTDHDGHIEVLKDDMGNEYMVNDSRWILEPDRTCRVVCVYTLSDNNVATIYGVAQPFTSEAVDESQVPSDSRVTDPIGVTSAYIGGGYLNMVLGIRVKNEESKHELLPVRMESDSLVITLYHNAGGGTGVYTKTAYLCIPLSGYGLDKNDTVFLKYHGYEEDCNMSLIYR